MPKFPTGVIFSAITLEEDSERPMYRQLCAALREAIVAGVLDPGVRLPSTRTLAGELEVSRNTVLAAYEDLVDEGYVESRVGASTLR